MIALCFFTVSAAHADQLNYDFPSAGALYFSATSGAGFVTGPGLLPGMSTAGDFVSETYFGGPDVADSAAFNFDVKDNLGGGNSELYYIFIDGTAIAQFTVPDDNYQGDYLDISGIVNFAPIDGFGTYSYTVQLQNTVPTGGGSVQFLVPEPGSLALLGSGLIGLAGLRRRKSML